MHKLWVPLVGFLSLTIPLLWAFGSSRQATTITEVRASIPPENYPKDYFSSPVSGAIHLTGTCGELRPDHFHAGADIDGRVGNPILAAADGYIDRIKVMPNGYGNVLYLKHPNGYTTVYAHLDRFSPDIQRYVKEYQYSHERFEVELSPPNGLFKVKKGQEIAKMGNSGSSGGSHLHFEIRSPSGRSINPLLCGLPVNDNVAPELRDMKVYFLTDKRQVVGSKAFPLFKDKKGHVGLENDTINLGGWRIGFGVKAYDRTTGHFNDNGVYSVALWADDQLAFEWRAESFDFDESRYMNAHIDYAAKQRYGAWFHRCFVLPGDRLSTYTPTPSMGSIEIFKDKPVKIRLTITDAPGNSYTLIFWVKRDANAMETFLGPPYQLDLPFDADSRFDLEGFSMQLSKGTLYENLPFQYSSALEEDDNNSYSPMHHLHDSRTPVHQYFDLSIVPNKLPPTLRSKAVVAYCGDGRPDNCGGTWQGEMLKTRVRNFGDYCIMADTVAPSITAVIFAADMRKKTSMAFRISDNFAISGTANGMRYRGTVDGKWILFEYDKKRARLTHDFDEHIAPGEHTLKLSVVDDRGNERIFERKFLR
jgi:hypothetical protein